MGNHESKKAFLFKTFQRKSSTVNIDRDQNFLITSKILIHILVQFFSCAKN